MDCETAHRLLDRYVKGDLAKLTQWRVDRHLERCPPCAQGFEFEFELAFRCPPDVPPRR